MSLAEPNVMNLLRKCDGMLALFKLAEGNHHDAKHLITPSLARRAIITCARRTEGNHHDAKHLITVSECEQHHYERSE